MPPLFPDGVAQTIHVSVLVGLLVLLFFTETYGWVFSGLVVPGYLASVLVFEPAAAAAVLGEAVLTFAIARFLSDWMSRTGAWSPFFGRDRFLLLIVVSILVRQASEIWLLPAALQWVDDRLGTAYHLSRSVASIGLVLVPLTANMFWKLDVRRGLVQVAMPTLITYAVVRLLLAHTNLSFSRLELTYEDVALEFLASPKAYILLCTGAFLASRYSLLYGWDYSGILVPALLGLAVFSPMRLATSAVETALLVAATTALVRLPGLRAMNLEGPRKIAAVFTVSFVLKVLLGLVPASWLPGLKVTDLFGFGYLVPSLMAVKILQKQAFVRVLGPSFAIALVSFVVGSGIGFGLERIAPPPVVSARRPERAPTPTRTLASSPMGAMGLAHARTRLDTAGEVPMTRSWRERQRYDELWRDIDGWLRDGGAGPEGIADRARDLGLSLQPLPDAGGRRAWLLIEAEERLGQAIGWDTAVLVPGAPGPVLEAPRPWTEAPAAEAAAALCARVQCRAVIASGVDTRELRIDDGDALQSRDAPLAIARRRLRSAPLVQVRADARQPAGAAVLYVAGEVPGDLRALWPPGLELAWRPPPRQPVGWRDGVSALVAHPDDLWRAIADSAPAPAPIAATSPVEWLAARRSTGQPGAPRTPPSQSELRFLERVLAPALLQPAAGGLRAAAALAAPIGYQAYRLVDGEGSEVWVLADAAAGGWGTLAGRPGGAPIAVEIPRPRREIGTLRLGVELWTGLGARWLLVAGDDADAPFQVLHQAVHAALGNADQPLVAEVRGFSAEQPVRDDLVVTLGRALLDRAQTPPRLAALLDEVSALGTARVHDGSAALLDLAGAGAPGLAYSARMGGATHAILWFSERARAAYREADRDDQAARLRTVGLALEPRAAREALAEPPLAATTAIAPALRARFDEVSAIAASYAARNNVQALRRLAQVAAADPAVAVSAGWSADLGRAYLRVEVRRGSQVMRGVVLVPGSDRPDAELAAGAPDLGARIDAALLARARRVAIAGAMPGEAR